MKLPHSYKEGFTPQMAVRKRKNARMDAIRAPLEVLQNPLRD